MIAFYLTDDVHFYLLFYNISFSYGEGDDDDDDDDDLC